jgi:hypothetical protein
MNQTHTEDQDDTAIPPVSATSVLSSTTNTINPKGPQTMNTTSTSTLVEGATVTGIVQSKNQHGVTLDVAGQSTFLPVGQLGDTPISDLAKGTELAVTVVDTTGAKPRVAIAAAVTEVAAPAVVTEVTEVASAVTEVADAAVETEEDTADDELKASIAKLAGAWGASVKFEKARTPSNKK